MQPNPRRVKGSHGAELHLLEWSTEGVPLLLLHGFGNDAHIWDDFAAVVAPYYRTLAMDHRGHGDSDWDPEGRYDHDAMVDDVECALEALGVERFVLIGHSLGGRISTLFAGRHPERLAGLVLVDIGPELDPRGRMRIRQEVESSVSPTFASVAEYARTLSLLYPEAPPEVVNRMALHGVKENADGRFELKMDPVLRGAISSDESQEEMEAREQALEKQMWEILGALPCPTLVVRGAASDILSPDVADRMVEDVIPNGRLAIVPRASHSVMTDNPEGFADAVSAFVLAE